MSIKENLDFFEKEIFKRGMTPAEKYAFETGFMFCKIEMQSNFNNSEEELEYFLKLEKEWTKNHTGVITQFAKVLELRNKELADLRKENIELMNLVEEAYGNGFKDGHYGGRIGANITSSKLDKIREPLTVEQLKQEVER